MSLILSREDFPDWSEGDVPEVLSDLLAEMNSRERARLRKLVDETNWRDPKWQDFYNNYEEFENHPPFDSFTEELVDSDGDVYFQLTQTQDHCKNYEGDDGFGMCNRGGRRMADIISRENLLKIYSALREMVATFGGYDDDEQDEEDDDEDEDDDGDDDDEDYFTDDQCESLLIRFTELMEEHTESWTEIQNMH